MSRPGDKLFGARGGGRASQLKRLKKKRAEKLARARQFQPQQNPGREPPRRQRINRCSTAGI